MQELSYKWNDDGEREIRLNPVRGTLGKPYLFGRGEHKIPVEISDFYILTTTVTQKLWKHVMGENPALRLDPDHPVDNVSWKHITDSGGFLDRINSSEILTALNDSNTNLRFRLPSETEWEYAARGGQHWTDNFRFSGSNDIDKVAWYGYKFGPARQLVLNTFGFPVGWRIAGKFPKPRRETHTHKVATKMPNQLGLYDMSGNVWEWCQDVCTDDLDEVPRDGTPFIGSGNDRGLRGGCHHNWDLHCTVSWRYGIEPDAHDGCIGFRLVFATQ